MERLHTPRLRPRPAGDCVSTTDGLAFRNKVKADIQAYFSQCAPPVSLIGKLHANSLEGPPLSGATVSCVPYPIDPSPTSGGTTLNTYTDDDGMYCFSDLSAGNQQLTFSKSGFESINRIVTITAGQTFDAGDDYLNPAPLSGGLQ